MKLHAETECVLLWPVTIQLHSSFSSGVNQSLRQLRGSCTMAHTGARTLVFSNDGLRGCCTLVMKCEQWNQAVHYIIISNKNVNFTYDCVTVFGELGVHKTKSTAITGI